jgi:hypothetical protein
VRERVSAGWLGWCFEQVAGEVRRAAARLTDHGLQPGERVAIAANDPGAEA